MIVKPQRVGVAFVDRRTGRFGSAENDLTRRKRRKAGIARNEVFVSSSGNAGGKVGIQPRTKAFFGHVERIDLSGLLIGIFIAKTDKHLPFIIRAKADRVKNRGNALFAVKQNDIAVSAHDFAN